MALTKIDLVQKVGETLGISNKNAAQIVESAFEIMKDQLSKGDKLKISGFGNFLVKNKNARKGRNPHTGDLCEISARKVLTFKASKILRNALNKSS
jgi:integration host factor subunit alpha